MPELGKNTVHILFTISLLLTLMKGVDLTLRPHQQKWLQDKLETLTLKLNYANVFKWYSKNLSSLMIKFTGVLSLLIVASFLHEAVNRIFATTIASNFILFLSTFGLAIFINFRTKPIQVGSFNYIGGKDVRENNKNYSLAMYTKRSLRVLLSYLRMISLILGLYYFGIYALDKFYLKQNLPVFLFSLISSFPVTIDFLGILISLLLILLLSGIVGILHLLLRLIEAICWRIVEYNKGALAAINVIITVVLGVTELYLKSA